MYKSGEFVIDDKKFETHIIYTVISISEHGKKVAIFWDGKAEDVNHIFNEKEIVSAMNFCEKLLPCWEKIEELDESSRLLIDEVCPYRLYTKLDSALCNLREKREQFNKMRQM